MDKAQVRSYLTNNVRIIFLTIAGLFSFVIHSMSQGSLLDVKRNSDKLQISDIRYVEDVEGTLTIEEVLTTEKLGEFKVFQGEKTSFENNEELYWVTFSITNQSEYDEEWIFDFGKFWSKIEVYQIDSNNNIVAEDMEVGLSVPYRLRHYPVTHQHYVLQTLPSKEELTYLVKLDGTGDIPFRAYIGPNINLDLRKNIDKKNSYQILWAGIFSSIFLFMFVYHLFLYYSTRKTSYLYYLGIVFCYLYLSLKNGGLLISLLNEFFVFDGNLSVLSYNVIPTLVGIVSVQFTRELLNTKMNLPFWDKILFYIIVALSLHLIGQLVGLPLDSLAYPIILAQMIVLGIVAVKSYIKKIPSGFYFLIAFSFRFFAIIISLAILLYSEIYVDFALGIITNIGWALEILFFSFAIGNIINVLKKENLESQYKYIEQLKENDALKTKVNRELEKKVKERTVELQKEKDVSESLLLNILPEFTAKELKETGKAAPRHYSQASVMFTDFKDFSMISSTLSSAVLVENLDICFKAFDEIIAKHDLEKIKTIGDSYMCAGGISAEVSGDNHFIRIAKAAIEITDFIKKWNQEKKLRGEAPWEIRIGIHSGPLTAGVVGKKKFAFDIWGETVNIASRMESACEPGKVNVSKDTWNLIHDQFEGTYRGKVKVKNIGEIEMFYVNSFSVLNEN